MRLLLLAALLGLVLVLACSLSMNTQTSGSVGRARQVDALTAYKTALANLCQYDQMTGVECAAQWERVTGLELATPAERKPWLDVLDSHIRTITDSLAREALRQRLATLRQSMR